MNVMYYEYGKFQVSSLAEFFFEFKVLIIYFGLTRNVKVKSIRNKANCLKKKPGLIGGKQLYRVFIKINPP
jgi:hypothetical protein